jgi:nitroreductase
MTTVGTRTPNPRIPTETTGADTKLGGPSDYVAMLNDDARQAAEGRPNPIGNIAELNPYELAFRFAATAHRKAKPDDPPYHRKPNVAVTMLAAEAISALSAKSDKGEDANIRTALKFLQAFSREANGFLDETTGHFWPITAQGQGNNKPTIITGFGFVDASGRVWSVSVAKNGDPAELGQALRKIGLSPLDEQAAERVRGLTDRLEPYYLDYPHSQWTPPANFESAIKKYDPGEEPSTAALSEAAHAIADVFERIRLVSHHGAEPYPVGVKTTEYLTLKQLAEIAELYENLIRTRITERIAKFAGGLGLADHLIKDGSVKNPVVAAAIYELMSQQPDGTQDNATPLDILRKHLNRMSKNPGEFTRLQRFLASVVAVATRYEYVEEDPYNEEVKTVNDDLYELLAKLMSRPEKHQTDNNVENVEADPRTQVRIYARVVAALVGLLPDEYPSEPLEKAVRGFNGEPVGLTQPEPAAVRIGVLTHLLARRQPVGQQSN